MSTDLVSSLPATAGASAAAESVTFERWPNDRVQAGLVADDAPTRLAALAMAAQPDAPVDDWVRELVRCVDLSRADAITLQLAATVLCTLKTQSARDIAIPCLVTLATTENVPPVRLAVAHSFWLYQCIPPQAWPSVSQMVFSEDAGLRKTAFSAALPHAEAGAAHIAVMAAQLGAPGWTTEGMDLLAASAGTVEPKKRQVEAFILRTLQGESNIAVIVAGYSALARLNPKGAGVAALAQVASSAPKWSDATLALTALSQLGELARAAIPALVKLLVETDDPEREELICHTLLLMNVTDREVPIARVLQRLESGPDQAVVAHCIFLGLHAKSFVRVAPLVAARFKTASEGLKGVLDAVYEMLTGTRLQAPSPTSTT